MNTSFSLVNNKYTKKMRVIYYGAMYLN